MNIAEVGQQLASILNKSGSLFFSSTGDFARDLTIGQMIKGKVLRSLDQGRYQVAFGGQEKVVDSSIPLRPGEEIQGRVVSLGEQVEVKKIASSQLESGVASLVDKAAIPGLLSKWENQLIQAMREFNVKFNSQQRADIIRSMKQSSNPQAVLLAAAAMAKQNLPVKHESLQLLDRLQLKPGSIGLYDREQLLPQLQSAELSSEQQPQQLQQLAAAIKQLVQQQEELARFRPAVEGAEGDVELAGDITQGDTEAKADLQQGDEHRRAFSDTWNLLNNQLEGAVEHRVASLPFWLNDRLIEVDVAMYQQKQNLQGVEQIDSRKLFFSLELEKLGLVEVEIILHNNRVRMSVTTDSSESTQALLSEGADLNAGIQSMDWSLDEISYMTREKEAHKNVVHSVLEHYASQDSLSRLM